MTTAIFKQINKNYRYVVLVILFIAVIAAFNSIASSNSQANSGQKNAEAKAQEQTTGLKTNLPANDPDLKELEKVIAGGDTPAAQNEASQGRVLAAQDTAAENTSKQYTSNFFTTAAESLSDLLAYGAPPTVYNATSTATGETYKVRVQEYSGALPSLINTMGGMYQSPPVSVEVWAQDIRDRIDPSVSAQSSLDSDTYNPGQGYELLSPIQALWRAAVNLVYIFYIVIVVGLAFLILFRSQLGGQEAVTLFNAIPSLIISLVLVYFSYPISALFIDGITVGSGITYGALIGDGSSGSTAPGKFLYEQTIEGDDIIGNPGDNLIEKGVNVIAPSSVVVDPKTDLQIDDKFVNVWQVFMTASIEPETGGLENIIPKEVPLVNALGNAIENIAGDGITDTILRLVFIFAAFSASLRLFFSLMRSYVYLIVLPLASPFIFLLAAIPGQTSNIVRQYFTRLAAAALSFVAVYAVFLVIIIIARDTTNLSETLWTPPLLGYSADQGINGTGLSNIARPLIAYALFISTPLIPDYIFELFSANDQSPFAENIKKTTQQGAGTLLGVGTFGWNQLRGGMGITPQGK